MKQRLIFAIALLVSASSVQAGDPFNGHRIYSKHCLHCHGETGHSDIVGTPDLSRGEGLMKPDFQLLQTLRNGVGTMPGYQGMITDVELNDVITYMRTLQ